MPEPVPYEHEPTHWQYRRGRRESDALSTEELTALFRKGELAPSTPITPAGKGTWRPAESWVEFAHVLILMNAALRARATPLAAFHLEAARKRALTLFVLFVGLALMVAAHLTAAELASPTHEDARQPFVYCTYVWWVAAFCGGVYCMSYLPGHWRVLAALPPAYAVMGFVGAIGLLVLAVATALPLLLGALLLVISALL